MTFKYSIIETRSADTSMQDMCMALASLHISTRRATHQPNPPRGPNAGGASSLSSTIEPDELRLRKRHQMSRPELCVGRRTGIGRAGGRGMENYCLFSQCANRPLTFGFGVWLYRTAVHVRSAEYIVIIGPMLRIA